MQLGMVPGVQVCRIIFLSIGLVPVDAESNWYKTIKLLNSEQAEKGYT